MFLQQLLWMVSTDPIGVWGEYINPLTAWLLGVAHYVDGSRSFQSLIGDVSTTELLCVAHGTIWLPLQSSSWFAITHCPFSVDDGKALASYALLEWSVFAMSMLQVITDFQVRGLIKPHKWKCGEIHSDSVSRRLRNPYLAVPIWTRTKTIKVEEMNSASCGGGIFQHLIIELCKWLDRYKCAFLFCFSIF